MSIKQYIPIKKKKTTTNLPIEDKPVLTEQNAVGMLVEFILIYNPGPVCMYFIIFHSLLAIATVHSSAKYGIFSQVTNMCPTCPPLEDDQLSGTSQNPAADNIWGFWASPAVQTHGGVDFCSSFTLCTPWKQRVVILGLSRSCVT